MESLQNIPGRGRLAGRMTRCTKLCPTNANEVWKAGRDRHAYQAAKRASNLAVHIAKTDAEKIAFKKINPKSVEIYRLAKQMRRENRDVIGDKPVRNNNGQMSLDVDIQKRSMERALYAPSQFSWNPGGLSEVYPVEGSRGSCSYKQDEVVWTCRAYRGLDFSGAKVGFRYLKEAW